MMRRQDREVVQQNEIDAIIESCDCLRLGLNAEDGAYIVPLNFAYVPGKPAKFYFHSAKEGRKVSMIGQSARAGFELDGAHRLGEAETGCKHTYFYQNRPTGGRAGGKEAGAGCHSGALPQGPCVFLYRRAGAIRGGFLPDGGDDALQAAQLRRHTNERI